MITHLIDTDRVIDYLNDKLETRRMLRDLIDQRKIALPIIVVGELSEGLLQEIRLQVTSAFNDLRAGLPVIGIDEPIAERFGQLRAQLRREGNLIGDHDIWIAATALQHNLTLITRDAHFDRIPSLKCDAMTG